MEGSGIGAIESFWFAFWRMALWGLGLGLGLGAAYGTLVGVPFVAALGILGPPLGAMFGAMSGAMAGLSLGLLEGLVLGAMNALRHRRGAPGDPSRYRRVAELACVAACVLAVAAFWGVVFWRPGDSSSVRVAFTRDLLEGLILVAGPLLLATGATWLAARRVAGRYARETAGGSTLEER